MGADNSSIFRISSSVNAVFSTALRLSAICATELAPIMTETTLWSWMSQLRAISARVCPLSAARLFSPVRAFIISGVSISGFRNLALAMRESAGMPFR